MKKFQKVLSILLCAVLIAGLCCITPVAAATNDDTASAEKALSAFDDVDSDDIPVEALTMMYNIINTMLTIEDLNITPQDTESITKAMQEAKTVIDNPASTKEDRQYAATQLTGAMLLLDKYMAFTEDEMSRQMLAVYCEIIRDMLEDDGFEGLTKEQKAALTDALDKASGIAADPNASQEEIEKAYNDLLELIASFVPEDEEGNRDTVSFLIESANMSNDIFGCLLTADEQNAVKQYISDLQNILAQDVITYKDVEKAYEISDKIDELLGVNDYDRVYTKTQLKAMIDNAQKYADTELYSEETVSDLLYAISEAQKIYNDPNATQEDISFAVMELADKMTYLEPLDNPEEPTEPTEPATLAPTAAPTTAATSPATGKNAGTVPTSDSSQTAVFTLLMISFACAAFLIISKKRKETI